MFITEDKAKEIVDEYGDMLYRFAFILTLSDEGASDSLDKALYRAGKGDLLTSDAAHDKPLLLSLVYKEAKKCKLPPYDKAKTEEKYGEKPQEFYDIASLPLAERAKKHLTLYEDYSEQDADTIIKGKLK